MKTLPRIIQITDIHEKDAFVAYENIVGTVMAPTTIEQTLLLAMYDWSYIRGFVLKSNNRILSNSSERISFYAVKYKVLFK